MKLPLLLVLCGINTLALAPLFGQAPDTLPPTPLILEGYVFEANNRGYVKNVRIKVLTQPEGKLLARATTNANGVFRVTVPRNRDLLVVAEKKLFLPRQREIARSALRDGEKYYLKMEFERKPGYVFDVTIAEPRQVTAEVGTVRAIDSARIEIYNNTTRSEELVLQKWPYPTFKFNFERGHHYTIMIRREGYFNKRIEAYVDVEGCILCFDGLGTVEPGVLDVMSSGNQMGTFLANVELEPLQLNTTYQIENIYYDYDKWDIRADAAVELDNLVGILKDNPAVTVELGSHTDSRGSAAYNLQLSEKRAQAAVAYLIERGRVEMGTLVAKGYGETQLVNRCRNGVLCDAQAHQKNRRTELKIVGIKAVDPLDNKSLKTIIEEERLLREIQNSEIKIEASK